jgi:multidrug transporter EmrE-like cation transporter
MNLPLGVASLQFVGAVLAAAFIFGEPINCQKWFGIGVICIGLML